MGARFDAVFLARPDTDAEGIRAGLQAAVDTVERQMSNWDPASDLNRLNDAAPGEWVPLPAPLLEVLDQGLEIGRASGGAFDIALGDLVSAWGFGPPVRQPDPARIRALTGRLRPAAGDILDLDRAGGRARLRVAAALDLSGIAKGYGVDRLADCLAGLGIADFLVGIDGELRAAGTRPDGTPWAVAIDTPTPGARAAMGVVDLRDRAIATSGGYRNRVMVGDVALSHTMDARVARPLQNGVAAVTVLADTCMAADAWATALMVLGPDDGPALARARGLDALFVVDTPGGRRHVTVGASPAPRPA